MKPIAERINDAAEEYYDKCLPWADHYKAGYRQGFTDPRVLELVEAAKEILERFSENYPARENLDRTLTAYQSDKEEMENL